MKRILFVDDEPMLLEVIEVRLSERSTCWEMDFTEAGERALELMSQKSYDVIVADMRMPEMDGVELLTRVKQEHPATARIMMSGLASDRDRSPQLGETVHQFVSKPCDFDELELTIARVLECAD